MKKTIIYILLILILTQVIGYYTIAKKLLIDSVIDERLSAERPGAISLENIESIKINFNYDLTENQKTKLQQLFKEKQLRYNRYYTYTDIPEDSLFLRYDLNYTIEISKYRFPNSIVFLSETKSGFGADAKVLYAWILIKWVKVKVISSGIS